MNKLNLYLVKAEQNPINSVVQNFCDIIINTKYFSPTNPNTIEKQSIATYYVTKVANSFSTCGNPTPKPLEQQAFML